MLVPVPSRRVLAQTSVWMLVPLYHSPHPLFSFLLVNTLCASVLHWTHYAPGSVLQHLDRGFSTCTLLFLLLHAPTPVPLVFAVGAFCAGSLNLRFGFHLQHLLWHLVFRALAFFCALHYCGHTSALAWALYLCAFCYQAAQVFLVHLS